MWTRVYRGMSCRPPAKLLFATFVKSMVARGSRDTSMKEVWIRSSAIAPSTHSRVCEACHVSCRCALPPDGRRVFHGLWKITRYAFYTSMLARPKRHGALLNSHRLVPSITSSPPSGRCRYPCNSQEVCVVVVVSSGGALGGIA